MHLIIHSTIQNRLRSTFPSVNLISHDHLLLKYRPGTSTVPVTQHQPGAGFVNSAFGDLGIIQRRSHGNVWVYLYMVFIHAMKESRIGGGVEDVAAKLCYYSETIKRYLILETRPYMDAWVWYNQQTCEEFWDSHWSVITFPCPLSQEIISEETNK